MRKAQKLVQWDPHNIKEKLLEKYRITRRARAATTSKAARSDGAERAAWRASWCTHVQ
jgi:hypothetical protein